MRIKQFKEVRGRPKENGAMNMIFLMPIRIDMAGCVNMLGVLPCKHQRRGNHTDCDRNR
ncbi:Uncharacterised protein [Vibrio cholerae]|nr:Uncharacterised protein [Vibrio cholerae]